jgi:hypothetical protein
MAKSAKRQLEELSRKQVLAKQSRAVAKKAVKRALPKEL